MGEFNHSRAPMWRCQFSLFLKDLKMKNRSIEPLPTWAIDAMHEFVFRFGDIAAAEHFGVGMHTCCRAALGLSLQPKIREILLARLEGEGSVAA